MTMSMRVLLRAFVVSVVKSVGDGVDEVVLKAFVESVVKSVADDVNEGAVLKECC